MEFAPTFQMGHPLAFELANRLAAIAPPGLDRVFFTNSGSESVDTALKIAHRLPPRPRRGAAHPPHRPREGLSRRRLRRHVGRRHGQQPQILRRLDAARASTICRTRSTSHTTRSRADCPHWGAHLANELERLIALHDASTIAAVIVEPISGSAGVILPPVGYLKRLREICDKHDILLIFDEVITGFGRIGKPFAAQAFDVTPDLMTTAKGLTNGAIPMGAVFAAAQGLRRLHAGTRQCDRAVPRLHLLGAPGGLRRRARDPRCLRDAKAC